MHRYELDDDDTHGNAAIIWLYMPIVVFCEKANKTLFIYFCACESRTVLIIIAHLFNCWFGLRVINWAFTYFSFTKSSVHLTRANIRVSCGCGCQQRQIDIFSLYSADNNNALMNSIWVCNWLAACGDTQSVRSPLYVCNVQAAWNDNVGCRILCSRARYWVVIIGLQNRQCTLHILW